VSYLAKVLTVSDSAHAGTRQDSSGPAVVSRLTNAGIAVVDAATVADGIEPVADALRRLISDFAGVVITTGGTGFGPRDLTPEATLLVVDRVAPGLAESMRSVSPQGRLSRAVAGTIGKCLVMNVPGSPNGAVECLDAVLDVLPHALDLLAGHHPH
jgi:molybdopterin adenylyltransferase